MLGLCEHDGNGTEHCLLQDVEKVTISTVKNQQQKDCSGWSRRKFLSGLGALGAAGAWIFSGASRAVGADPPPTKPRVPAKNLLFFVSDGMSAGVLTLAEQFSQSVRGRGTNWISLLSEPGCVQAQMDTASANSLVTDSAAASSAWGCGHRVNNGALNILPDGAAVPVIGQIAKASGKKFGLVTTATVTHATPAGFAINEASRKNEASIAEKYFEVVDVLLGGGLEFFAGDLREDKSDLLERYRGAGYTTASTREELLSKGCGERCLGLFGKGFLPYTIDWQQQPDLQKTVPTLSEMASGALESLSRHPEGFLLQVEGARVDGAAHQNDIAALLWDQLAFDDAVGVGLEFLKTHPDTLMIVTSDHGNANPGLNGMGPSYSLSTSCFEKVANAKCSFFAFTQWAKERMEKSGELSVDEVRAKVFETFGLWVGNGEAYGVTTSLRGMPVGDWNFQEANFWAVLAQTLGNQTGVGWTGITHTADPTLLSAIGPGSERFGGWIRNDEVFEKMCASLALQGRS